MSITSSERRSPSFQITWSATAMVSGWMRVRGARRWKGMPDVPTTVQRTPDHLHRLIEDPNQFKPGIRMPALGMAPEDRSAIVAYLERLR